MITARNYAAQAQMSLSEHVNYLFYSGKPNDAKYSSYYMKSIAESVHFALPDSAKLLDDNLKGVVGGMVKLPFPVITVEYFAVSLGHTAESAETQKINIAKKICILCVQHPSSMYDEPGFSMHTFICDSGGWATVPIGVFIPENIMTSKFTVDDFKIIATLPESGKNYYGDMPESIKKKHVHGLLVNSVLPVLEMIEALSCRNITTENIQEASSANAKRIKQGKLPIYETKCLVINSSRAHAMPVEPGGGTHASPRQHLRRGHIRRLPSGNYWVNSCVVGDSTKGIIKKSYEVRA